MTISKSTSPVEIVDLHEHLAALRQALDRGERPPAGALLGLPPLDNDVWVDIAGAAAVAGVAPKTITGWLSRGQPKRLPFPAPIRILYRLYWPLSAIESWRQNYTGQQDTNDHASDPGARSAS
ncbi:hypothetical protein [Nonomuraea sp. B5E05]|uniref:hypothetical protein n=1 Tax=Nonomuraea sp. B5E05 TaxID=3153569 RepID=UPI0032610E21